MLGGVLLSTLETYYDDAPRPLARTEQVGPFTLFLHDDPEGWPFYARPTRGHDGPFSAPHVEQVRERQRELGVPEAVEWVHETTPTLLAAAREAGLHVTECPLLVLPHGATALAPPQPEGVEVRMLEPDSPDLARAAATVAAAFAGVDEVKPGPPGPLGSAMRAGLLAMAAAYDGPDLVGGGSHGLRGSTSELTGIGVLPRARRRGVGAAITAALVADARARGATTVFLSAQDEAVARVYERIGFQRVGTACVASAPEG